MISVNTKLDETLAGIDGSDVEDRRGYIRSLWEFDSYNNNGFQDNVCPECGTKTLTKSNNGEVFCEKCGLVSDNNIDRGPDWKNHSYKEIYKFKHTQARYIGHGKKFFRWTHNLRGHAIVVHMANWDENTSMYITEKAARKYLIERYNKCCVQTFRKIPDISIIGSSTFACKYKITRNEARKCLETSDRYVRISTANYLDISRTGIINEQLLSIILSSEKKLQIISSLQRVKRINNATRESLIKKIATDGLQVLNDYGIIVGCHIPRIEMSFYYFSNKFW